MVYTLRKRYAHAEHANGMVDVRYTYVKYLLSTRSMILRALCSLFQQDNHQNTSPLRYSEMRLGGGGGGGM